MPHRRLPIHLERPDLAVPRRQGDTGPMLWIVLGSATLVVSVTAQAGPAPGDGHFTYAELRMMCRGETEGNPQFRTQASYEMLAQYQRAKCRMYLLGVADGIGWHRADARACTPAANERETLGDQLVEAVLQAPVGPETSIRGIVAAALIARPPCR